MVPPATGEMEKPDPILKVAAVPLCAPAGAAVQSAFSMLPSARQRGVKRYNKTKIKCTRQFIHVVYMFIPNTEEHGQQFSAQRRRPRAVLSPALIPSHSRL